MKLRSRRRLAMKQIMRRKAIKLRERVGEIWLDDSPNLNCEERWWIAIQVWYGKLIWRKCAEKYVTDLDF